MLSRMVASEMDLSAIILRVSFLFRDRNVFLGVLFLICGLNLDEFVGGVPLGAFMLVFTL